jgi:hypothetical protein
MFIYASSKPAKKTKGKYTGDSERAERISNEMFSSYRPPHSQLLISAAGIERYVKTQYSDDRNNGKHSTIKSQQDTKI